MYFLSFFLRLFSNLCRLFCTFLLCVVVLEVVETRVAEGSHERPKLFSKNLRGGSTFQLFIAILSFSTYLMTYMVFCHYYLCAEAYLKYASPSAYLRISLF